MRFYEIINESSPKEEERLKRAREQGYNVDDPHYHGTPGGDFDEFDPERTADEDLAYGAGVYMSRDPDAASGYSIPGSSWGNSDHDREQARPTVYKVYHRLKNPFDLQKLYPYPEVKRILTHCFTPQELQHIELWQELMNDVAYSSRYAEDIDELHEQLMNIRYRDVEIDPDDYEEGENDPDFIKDRDELLDDEEKSLKQRIARLEGWEAEAQAAHNKALADGKIGNVYGRDIYRTLWTNTDGYHDWKAESQLFGGETETIEFKTEANRWLEELGYDGLKHVDRYNPGNKGVPHSVTIAFRPQHVRSVHANFDPDKIDSPKLSEAILTEKVWLDDRGFPFGVNPTRGEFLGKFKENGAAGVLMKNGSLAVGNAPSLTHADLAATCGFESKDIKYHLQIWDVLENGTISIEVELWDETEGVQRGASKKFPKPMLDKIRQEIQANPNISRLKMPVVLTVRDPDWEVILRENSDGKITLTDLYDNSELYDRSEAIGQLVDSYGSGLLSERFTVREMMPADAMKLKSFGGTSIRSAFRKAASKEQKEIVQNKKTQFDPSRIIVISRDRVVDGHHHLIAAIQLNRPVKYIDLEEEPLTEVARPKTRTQADAILRNAGYTRLGKGSFGAVYQKPGKPYVLKVFTAKDRAYKDFVALAMAHQDNPHFPKFFGKIVHVTPDICAIRMEPLTPYKFNQALITMARL